MGLFTPEEARLALQQQDSTNALALANVAPGRMPVFGMAQAGSMLGRGVAGALGYQDPSVKKAKALQQAMLETEQWAEKNGVYMNTDPEAYMATAHAMLGKYGLFDVQQEVVKQMDELRKTKASQMNAEATMMNAQGAQAKALREQQVAEKQKAVYDQTYTDFSELWNKRKSGEANTAETGMEAVGARPEANADFHDMLAANYAAEGLTDLAKEARETAKDIRGKVKDRYMVVGKLVFNAQAGQWIQPPDGANDDGARAKQAALIEQAMIEDGFAPGIARQIGLNVASGRWVAVKDPETGEVTILDYASQKPVSRSAGGTGARGASGGSKTAESDIDPTEATGGIDVIKNVANAVADFVGREIPYPKTQEAKDALTSLRLRTLSVLQGSGSWRPSVFTSKLLDEATQQPLKFFQGDQISRSRMNETRNMIGKEVEVIDRLLKGPLRPNVRTELRVKREELSSLKGAYDTIVDAFDKKGSKKRPPLEAFQR